MKPKQSSFIDLTGQRFGKLLVEKTGTRDKGQTMWWCLCDCGNRIPVSSYSLRKRGTASCGCVRASNQDEYAVRERRALGYAFFRSKDKFKR